VALIAVPTVQAVVSAPQELRPVARSPASGLSDPRPAVLAMAALVAVPAVPAAEIGGSRNLARLRLAAPVAVAQVVVVTAPVAGTAAELDRAAMVIPLAGAARRRPNVGVRVR
jgi:hypothetical protein